MNNSLKLLSDIVVYTKYSRYIESEKRRESFSEIVERNKQMHLDKFPSEFHDRIHQAYTLVDSGYVLPSMRSMQFAGAAIKSENARMYNCCFLNITKEKDFRDIMYLLMCGCGVGYSVQKHHINQLPVVINKHGLPTEPYVIEDTAAGWSETIYHTITPYFLPYYSQFDFDYSKIRPAGSVLKTSGGVAPGSVPLMECVRKIRKVMDMVEIGSRLSPIQVHDIVCIISESVLAGGVRRSAMISLFDNTDDEMINCKSGKWYKKHPYRAFANNSAVFVRQPGGTPAAFKEVVTHAISSDNGEPGFFWTNDEDSNWGTNPCAEIGLRSHQFCNLVDINLSKCTNSKEFHDACKSASFISTLQATYTDFNYISDEWKKVTETERLIGVGITGIQNSDPKIITSTVLRGGAFIVKKINTSLASELGIRDSARCTTVKPAGSTSCVFGTTSGIHCAHSEFYIRRIRVNKNTGLYDYLLKNNPEIIKDYSAHSNTDHIIEIPITLKNLTGYRKDTNVNLQMFQIEKFYSNWILFGHTKGVNTNNVSCTVTYKESEKDTIVDTLFRNRHNYASVSVFPYDNDKYAFAPFEEIDEDTYNEMESKLRKDLDFSKITEGFDHFKHEVEAACAGGVCQI